MMNADTAPSSALQRAPRHAFLLLALALPALASADEAAPEQLAPPVVVNSKSLSEHTAEYARDYLSDPRRAGSLVGSILGGALSAHPAGPMVGGILGFLVGKSTLFEDEDDKSAMRAASTTRPIVTSTTAPVATLSFGAGAAADGTTLAAPAAPAFIAATAAAAATAPMPAISPEQLASLCNRGPAAEHLSPAHARVRQLRLLCFYGNSQ